MSLLLLLLIPTINSIIFLPMETDSQNLKEALTNFMLINVPSYANKLFYSLGFLSMISFVLLIITGTIMIIYGPDWWLTSHLGTYIRSVHTWATQAFVFFILLHLLVVFLTSGYKKPRRLTWVLGTLMFFFVLMEAEFGYVLRGDFSSQWRSLQASDLYNGSGIGLLINNLNYAQIYGIHIVAIPLLIILLLVGHYILVKVRGIAKPYTDKVKYRMVKANHTILFIRGGALVLIILILALVFSAPFISPVNISQVAKEDPSLFASTLMEEFTHQSDTATYLDNIDPYQYDTRQIYIAYPYEQYVKAFPQTDMLAAFYTESTNAQNDNIAGTEDYFKNNGKINTEPNFSNPLIPLVSSLTVMAQSGLYEGSIAQEDNQLSRTYTTRLLADTGVMDSKAEALNITTDQYGMIHEESGILPAGAWWLTPIGVLDHTLLATDPNQDRDGAIIIGLFIFFILAFPYIPFLNRLPELFKIDRFIWKTKDANMPPEVNEPING